MLWLTLFAEPQQVSNATHPPTESCVDSRQLSERRGAEPERRSWKSPLSARSRSRLSPLGELGSGGDQ